MLDRSPQQNLFDPYRLGVAKDDEPTVVESPQPQEPVAGNAAAAAEPSGRRAAMPRASLSDRLRNPRVRRLLRWGSPAIIILILVTHLVGCGASHAVNSVAHAVAPKVTAPAQRQRVTTIKRVVSQARTPLRQTRCVRRTRHREIPPTASTRAASIAQPVSLAPDTASQVAAAAQPAPELPASSAPPTAPAAQEGNAEFSFER